MKKYDSIIKRVEKYEKKCKITYAKSNGKLFKVLRIICTLFSLYAFVINMLACISLFMQASALNKYEYLSKMQLCILLIFTVISLISALLLYNKQNSIKASSLFLLMAANCYFILVFYSLSNNGLGFFKLSTVFYWRHLLPFSGVFICCIWMLAIVIRQEIKQKVLYNRILNNLYSAYGDSSKPLSSLTDPEWEEFLENYDPGSVIK